MISDGDALTSNGTANSIYPGVSTAIDSANSRDAINTSANGTHKASMVTNGVSRNDTLIHNTRPYRGHDREELTRLLIQTLSDLGYKDAAESVGRESGFQLESPTVAAFRIHILGGSWAEAEGLLNGASLSVEDDKAVQNEGNGLVLAPGADKNMMRFWIRQQKYLELLELKETARALAVLRAELTPLHHDPHRLHFLSSLLMCMSKEDLMEKANWDGAQGHTRKDLLSQLTICISPSVMLPEGRLADLLNQVKRSQVHGCMWHTSAGSPSLYSDHYCDHVHFPNEVALQLTDMSDEVWGLQFSHNGRRLAAFGKSESVTIWDIPSFAVLRVLGDHAHGVTSLSWSPDDSMIVTCSRDKYTRLWNAETGQMIKRFERFGEAASGCVWAPDGRSFVASSLDKDHSIRSFNLDGEITAEWGKKHRVQDMAGSANGQWLAVVDDQRSVYIYNAVTRQLEVERTLKARATSVSISEDARHVLVNRRDGEAQLIELSSRTTVQKFLGHTGGDCLIRSAFGGANESFIVSGSEDGRILIWHKNSGAAVERLEGHSPRTNAVVWNPQDPCMIASGGDDGVVKIWSNKARGAALRRAASAAGLSNGWAAERGDA